MTRKQVAAILVVQALRKSGASFERSGSHRFGVPPHLRLKEIVPGYEKTGRTRFLEGVNVAARGFQFDDSMAADDTLGSIVTAVANRLPMRFYSCQDKVELHFYPQKGSGICPIDGTKLVEVKR